MTLLQTLPRCQLLLLLPALLLLLGPIALAAAQSAAHPALSLLASATSYDAQPRLRTAPGLKVGLNMTKATDPVGYIPAFMYIISRHTMRNPTAGKTASINTLAPLIQRLANSSAAALHPWLKTWVSPVAGLAYAQGEVVPLGVKQTISLGKRYARRYPSLVSPVYYSASYPTDCTYVPRTGETASAFFRGFMPSAAPFIKTIAQDSPLSPLLRFYEVCPTYIKYKNSVAPWTGALLQNVEAALAPWISSRLKLGFNLSACDVDNLINACSFEGGALLDPSKTCSLFDTSDLNQLQWAADIDAFMTKAHGAPINYRIAAPLLGDITSYLTTAATAPEPRILKMRLAVAHAETLMPLSALLGLFNNSAPWANYQAPPAAVSNSACPASNSLPPAGWVPPFGSEITRTWKQGSVAPYNTHIAFVLYRNASAAANATSLSSYLVRLLFNEQQLAVPGCEGESVGLDCPLPHFLAVNKPKADPRIFDQLCNTSYYAPSAGK